MTEDEIHSKLRERYDEEKDLKVQDAASRFSKFKENR
jgi:hypothetical protein